MSLSDADTGKYDSFLHPLQESLSTLRKIMIASQRKECFIKSKFYVLLEPSQMEGQWPRGSAFMLRSEEEYVWTKGPDVVDWGTNPGKTSGFRLFLNLGWPYLLPGIEQDSFGMGVFKWERRGREGLLPLPPLLLFPLPSPYPSSFPFSFFFFI